MKSSYVWMAQNMFRRKTGCGRWRKTWPSGNDETDENVGKVRTLVRTDRHLGIRMTEEDLNMHKEAARQILTTNFSRKQLCAKMVPKSPPVFRHKTNTNARTPSVLTTSCPIWLLPFPNWKFCSKEPIFSQEDSHRKTVELLKALSQNGFRRCFEGWRDRMGRCVAFDGNYFEGDDMDIK
jgi:hypothetical protein